MEFEDQEEQEEELCMGAASYDSLPNSSRVKIPGGAEAIMASQPLRNNNNNNSNGNSFSNSGGGGGGGAGGGGKVRYRECLKNHAVGIGGHALDGCGEFMPAGTEGSLDALKCAACNCHRNFHRKETAAVTPAGDTYMLPHHHPPPPQFATYYRSPSGYLHMAGQQRTPLALPSTSGGGGGGGTQSTREDQEEDMSNPSAGGGSSSKKRFRTKFTQEQKEKMLELAERLGWRIQKHDEGVVQEFCNESGVKRHVLKVWMHNNKHTLALWVSFNVHACKGGTWLISWGKRREKRAYFGTFFLTPPLMCFKYSSRI